MFPRSEMKVNTIAGLITTAPKRATEVSTSLKKATLVSLLPLSRYVDWLISIRKPM